MEGLRQGDVNAMLASFAVESYVENYDFDAMLERMQSYIPNQDPRFPATNGLTRGLNLQQRQGSIANQIAYQYMALCVFDDEPYTGMPISFKDSEWTMEDFPQLLGDAAYMDRLASLEVKRFVAPEKLAEMYEAEANQRTMQRNADMYGADELVSVAALVQLDGQGYLLSADVGRYGNRWYNITLMSNLAMLLGAPALSGGVLPAP